MAAGVEKLINSSLGLQIAASLAQAAPPRLGQIIARLAADWLASRRNSVLVRAMRSNQWVVSGGSATSGELDEAARTVLRNSARSIYELYHHIGRPESAGDMYRIDASFEPVTRRPEFDTRGMILAGLHMAGFDLGLRWLCLYKIKPIVLTISSPEGGRQLELESRRKMHMNVLPTTNNGLRTALRHLQRGGMVVTGIDHAVPGIQPRPCFFGRPAALPVDYIYLALKAHVPVVVGMCRLEADGRYGIHASEPIEMEEAQDRTEALRRNGEKVLAAAEALIRQSPLQWTVSLPVWPEAMAEVPSD